MTRAHALLVIAGLALRGACGAIRGSLLDSGIGQHLAPHHFYRAAKSVGPHGQTGPTDHESLQAFAGVSDPYGVNRDPSRQWRVHSMRRGHRCGRAELSGLP
jgi:hypothetical protein